MNSIKKTARTTGLLYLIYIVFQALPTVLGSTNLVVNGDAITTARNIMTSGGLFRMGYLIDLLAAALFLLAAWALYVLLKRVNQNVALLFLLLNLGGVAIQCFSDLFLIGSQILLSGADYLRAFQADQLQTMSMLFLNLHESGFMVAQLFFAFWLFPLGYLVFKSNYLPRALGILLMVECFGWLMYPLQFFLSPSSVITYISSAIGFIGEFSLALWLLIMGAKDQKPALVETE